MNHLQDGSLPGDSGYVILIPLGKTERKSESRDTGSRNWGDI